MKRADLDKRAQRDKFGAGKHGFQSGNPIGGVLPTIPGADWFDHVQEEVANVIEAAKYTIDPNKYNQLLTAINQLIANVFETREEKSIDEVSESLMQDCIVSYPRGEKTGAVQAPVKVFNIVGKTGAHWRHQLHFRAYSTEVYIKSQQSTNSERWIIKRLDGADWSDVRGKPNTVAGYGITDGVTQAQLMTVISGKANLATTLAGYGITDAVRNADFTGSIAATGWRRTPDGLIEQWGVLTHGDIISTTAFPMTFPIAFPNAVFVVNGNSGSNQPCQLNVINVTRTGCTMWITEANQVFATGTVFWRALGN